MKSGVDVPNVISFFFLKDPGTTEISPLPLPDALPIPRLGGGTAGPPAARARDGEPRGTPGRARCGGAPPDGAAAVGGAPPQDRKSTRLNSSHDQISYAVFCLKKKKQRNRKPGRTILTH